MNFSKPQTILRFILFFRPQMKGFLIFLALVVAVLGILAPILQKFFVDQLTNSQSFGSNVPTWVWLLSSGLSLLLSLVCYQTLVFFSTQEAVKTQHALSEILYQKLLTLRPLDYQKKTTGDFISVYATDIPSSTILIEQSLPQGLNILFPLILAPLVLILYFDVPALNLIPALVFFVLLNLALAYRQSLFFYRFKNLAAKRIGIVNEWIQNIRALRILNWIPIFENKIYQARVVETHNRIRMLNNGQTMNAISSSMTFAMTAYILWLMTQKSNQPLSPGNLLAIFWIVSIFLTRTFRQLPWFFTFLFDAWTSIRRLSEAFALGPQSDLNMRSHAISGSGSNSSSLPESNRTPFSQALLKKPQALKVNNLNLVLNNQNILKNIHFEILPGEFVALVGSVGSGKSLLLLSLLGETEATFDSYYYGDLNLLTIPKTQWKHLFSYIPQDGFLMSASLRDNLHFEYQASKGLDSKLLNYLPKVQFDILAEGLTHHLDTEVGERGVNLSGGQKQRLSLARTLLRPAPIHLFDDCLSAVDVNTEALLIEEIFNQDFARNMRFLVTARFQVLKNVQRILMLDQGALVAVGSFETLLQESKAFYQFIHSAKKEADAPRELI